MSLVDNLPRFRAMVSAEPIPVILQVKTREELEAAKQARDDRFSGSNQRAWIFETAQVMAVASHPCLPVTQSFEELASYLIQQNKDYKKDLLENPKDPQDPTPIRQPIGPKFYHGISGNSGIDSQPSYRWHLQWDDPEVDRGTDHPWMTLNGTLTANNEISVVGSRARIVFATNDPETIINAIGMGFVEPGMAPKKAADRNWRDPQTAQFLAQVAV